MATAFKNSNGEYQLQFKGSDGRRKTLWLGKVHANFAEEFRLRVEGLLSALHSGRAIDKVTQSWLDCIDAKSRKRLEAKGLLDSGTIATISQLCDYVIERAEVSERTLAKYQDAKANLVSYFGASRCIFQITPGDADEFVAWLKKFGKRPTPGPLSQFTVSKRVEQVKLYFNAAVRKRWLAESPFDGITVPAIAASDRKAFISSETVAKVMSAADPELRLIIAMARYLGLRTPSETWPLKWEWVNWEEGTIAILDSKRQRHGETKKWRFPPIFPEIQELLWNHFNSASTDPVYIFNRKWTEVTDTALRNRLERLCVRANVQSWVKPWQNLRSTRETELVDQGFPLHVVCAWIGNNPKVAHQHYLQVTKEHTSRALADTSSGLQSWAALARKPLQETTAPQQNQVEA